MFANKWDKRFLNLAEHISTWSKDKRQVGAVVAHNNRLVSVGYNGFPAGIADDYRLLDKPTKLKIIIHAEENAILSAKQDLTGCCIYIHPLPPCPGCASKIIQSGIKRVVILEPSEYHIEKFSFGLVSNLFKEAKIELITIDK